MPGGIHAPIEEILRWPIGNYINPTTRPNTILLTACICGPITCTMLMTRLWVRMFHQRNPGWDDWLMVAATIPTIALTVLLSFAPHSGFDRHIWDIDLIKNSKKVVDARKYVLAILCIFCTASGLIKISILLFYRRLSDRVVTKRFRWITWITIAFIAAYTIALTLAPIFGCDPISAFWEQANVDKVLQGYKYRCFDEGADVVSASVLSALQDLVTAILPTLLYWNLRIPTRQKIALFGIFAIGYGVAALGALRAYLSWQIYYNTYDVTWVSWELFLVTMLELHLGCFCANAPTFKVFFKHFFQDRLTSSLRYGSSQKGQKSSQLSGTQSYKSTASILKEKVTIFFSMGSSVHTRNGYLPEAQGEFVMDADGGLQMPKEIRLPHSPAPTIGTQPTRRDLRDSTDTTDMIYDRYYDDIELGCYTTMRNSQVSSLHSQSKWEGVDIEALPAIPRTPRSPQARGSSMPFYRDPRSPRTSTHPNWPNMPLPAIIADEKNDDGSYSLLYPPRSTSQRKPQWRTWK